MTVTFRDLTDTAQRAGHFVTKYKPGRVTTYRVHCQDVDFFAGCCLRGGHGHLSTTSTTVATAWLEGYIEGRASKPTPPVPLAVEVDEPDSDDWREVFSIDDHGSIVLVYLKNPDGSNTGDFVGFDHRQFRHLCEARGIKASEELEGQRVRIHGDFGSQTLEFEDEGDDDA